MKADFLDAHRRHWDDAQYLYRDRRWANADHLYGMAAECGLKLLMLKFGMPYDGTKGRPSKKDDRVHADGVWARFESYRQGHVLGTGYALSTVNPFANWEVADRYVHQSNFVQARVQDHQIGAQQVCDLIAKAQREGLL